MFKIHFDSGRRKFLTKVLKMGVAGVIFPKEVLADLASIIDFEGKNRIIINMSYQEGLDYIYKEIFKTSKEMAFFYFESNKEEEGINHGWYQSKDCKGGFFDVFLTSKEGYQAIYKNFNSFERFVALHTHPAFFSDTKLSFLSHMKLFKKFTDFPSSGDFLCFLLSVSRIREAFFQVKEFNLLEAKNLLEKYSFEILTPAGHWHVGVDCKDENTVFKFFESQAYKDANLFREGVIQENEIGFYKELSVLTREISEALNIVSEKNIGENADFDINDNQSLYFFKKRKERYKTKKEMIEKIFGDFLRSKYGINIDYRALL